MLLYLQNKNVYFVKFNKLLLHFTSSFVSLLFWLLEWDSFTVSLTQIDQFTLLITSLSFKHSQLLKC
jgi:hypothetical protein